MSERTEYMCDESAKDVGAVLEKWKKKLSKSEIIDSGLINKTLKIETSNNSHFILQQLNPRFSSSVTDKINRLTPHLASNGLRTFHVVTSSSGRTSEEFGGNFWRLLTFIDGVTFTKVNTIQHACEAGKFLAKFHLALDGYIDEQFESAQSVHNIDLHYAKLNNALELNQEHVFYSEVKGIAETLFRTINALPSLNPHQEKVLHGDPKISNFLFSKDGQRAECLLDLDTVGPMSLPFELGDAFRSWCNPNGEDDSDGVFDSDLFKSAYEGYATMANEFLTRIERKDLVLATLHIYFELAARFLLDVFQETYFKWDDENFSSCAAHNLVRAKGQFSAGQDLLKQFYSLSTYLERNLA